MSEFKRQNESSENDLDWIAFCYVADELGQQEKAQFESLLESDSAAREAVAQAMELASMVYETGNETIAATDKRLTNTVAASGNGSPTAPTSKRSVYPLVMSLVAALLLAIGITAWWPSDSGTVEPSTAINDSELALAWVDSLEEVAFNESDDEASEDAVEFRSLDTLLDSDNEDWMFAALDEIDNESDDEGMIQ